MAFFRLADSRAPRQRHARQDANPERPMPSVWGQSLAFDRLVIYVVNQGKRVALALIPAGRG